MNRASHHLCLRIEKINNALLHQLLWTRALSALIGHIKTSRKACHLSNLRLQEETAIGQRRRTSKQPTTTWLNKVTGTKPPVKQVIRSKHHYDRKGIQCLTFQLMILQLKLIHHFSLIFRLKWLNTAIKGNHQIQVRQWSMITSMQILHSFSTIRRFPALMTIQMQWELKSFCSGKLDKAQTSPKSKRESPTKLDDKWRISLRNRN